MYYVYAYCNKLKPISSEILDYEPFYIGKGCKNRYLDHLKLAQRGQIGKRLTHIRNLGSDVVIVKVGENLSEQEAWALEVDLILEFGRLDLGTGPLFNCTPGGDGPRHSPEIYRQIGDKLRGRKAPPEVGLAISRRLTGVSRNQETRENISKGLLGKKHTQERRKNIVAGMQDSIEKQRKKWLIVTPETSFCIVSLDYLAELGASSIYRSYQNGKPLKKGKFKGWQLFQITVS